MRTQFVEIGSLGKTESPQTVVVVPVTEALLAAAGSQPDHFGTLNRLAGTNVLQRLAQRHFKPTGDDHYIFDPGGESATVLMLPFNPGDDRASRSAAVRRLVKQAGAWARQHRVSRVELVAFDEVFGEIGYLQAALTEAGLINYYYPDYRTKDRKPERVEVSDFCLTGVTRCSDGNLSMASAIADGIAFARDLIVTPPNHLSPRESAELVRDKLRPLGFEVNILDRAQLEEIGAGGILAVGAASQYEPVMLAASYDPEDPVEDVVFGMLGKGINFDIGGQNIKLTAAHPEAMIGDMAGYAAVAGAALALGQIKPRVPFRMVAPICENMVGSKAQPPSAVLTQLDGSSTQVMNTDAEGRIVLGDAMTYVQQTLGANRVSTWATLTGASIVALGDELAGRFTDSDELRECYAAAGESSAEGFWDLPLRSSYRRRIDSGVADRRNLTKKLGQAGATDGALFVGDFVEDGTEWIHFDIAGPALVGLHDDVVSVPGFGVETQVRAVQRYSV